MSILQTVDFVLAMLPPSYFDRSTITALNNAVEQIFENANFKNAKLNVKMTLEHDKTFRTVRNNANNIHGFCYRTFSLDTAGRRGSFTLNVWALLTTGYINVTLIVARFINGVLAKPF